MINRSWCGPVARPRVSRIVGNLPWFLGLAAIGLLDLSGASKARAGDAPAWMHAAAGAPLPEHDEKTDVVTIYSEDITIVVSDAKVKTIERRAYKILRPDGRRYGTVET
jgi:hypothetical protein